MHHATASLNRVAATATLHCLTGCAIGEVLGMVIGTALGLSNPATIALAVLLAFCFGYALTMVPLLRAGLAFCRAAARVRVGLFSIAVMELVDNGVMLAVPGAMDATLRSPLFWGALAFALAVAFVFAYPLNRYLIARGRGHAVVHAYHGHGGQRPTSSRRRSARGALLALGIAAVVVTVVVAAGGAMIVESRGEDEPAGPHPVTSGRELPSTLSW